MFMHFRSIPCFLHVIRLDFSFFIIIIIIIGESALFETRPSLEDFENVAQFKYLGMTNKSKFDSGRN
jgi:hypothetical protein